MEFRAAVFSHGLAEVSKIGERRNHPCTGLWVFVVRGRNLVGIFEEAPRETQVAAKSFVPIIPRNRSSARTTMCHKE